jgi:DNA-binding beta-propeller fold protein YncE
MSPSSPLRCRHRFAACLAAGLAVGTTTVHAQPYAFIAAPGASPPVVHVVDVATMTLERSIGGVFDEPAAFALSPDRTRLFVSSWRVQANVQTGRVVVIDTRLRQVVATQVVGEAQSRAIALSPDGSVVYAWALALSAGPQQRRLVQLDAATLTVIGDTTLPQPDCLATSSNALAVHPDGRVLLLACESGLKWFDPATATVVDAPGTLGGSNLVGFSPNATEVYLTDERGPENAQQSRLTSLDLASGVEQRFAYAVPIGQPVPLTASRPRRVRYVQRPGDPPGQPAAVVLFGPGGSLQFAQIFGVAPWPELLQGPSPTTRRIVSSAVVGASGGYPDGQLVASDDGTTLLVAGGATRRFDAASFAPSGPVLTLAGVTPGVGDAVLVPFPPDAVFADGFEP